MEKALDMALAAAVDMVANIAVARQRLPVGRHQTPAHDSVPVLCARVGAAGMALPQRASRDNVDSAHLAMDKLCSHLCPGHHIKKAINI